MNIYYVLASGDTDSALPPRVVGHSSVAARRGAASEGRRIHGRAPFPGNVERYLGFDRAVDVGGGRSTALGPPPPTPPAVGLRSPESDEHWPGQGTFTAV
jgi:hypothetical protein